MGSPKISAPVAVKVPVSVLLPPIYKPVFILSSDM
jgi:hypothetical protein